MPAAGVSTVLAMLLLADGGIVTVDRLVCRPEHVTRVLAPQCATSAESEVVRQEILFDAVLRGR